MKLHKLTIFVSFLLVLGCSHNPENQSAPNGLPQVEAPPPIENFDGTVVLQLKGEKGRKEISSNCSETVTQTFEGKDILHKRIETLDFKVMTSTKGIRENGNLLQDITTIQRDGPGVLHDLAYPELREVIDMEITNTGKIVKAGKFRPDSLFYLPSIPLPDHPVKQNEEWVSENSWKSENSGAPLTVELHEKVVGFKKCGTHKCASIAVHGLVKFPTLPSKTKYTHVINGRFLFDPESGLVPWSEFRSDEEVKGAGAQAVVVGRLRSELLEPRGYRTINREEPTCPFESKAE